MAIIDLFSKRQRRLRGEAPDVYQYEAIPPELRVQIVHIVSDALGDDDEYFRAEAKQAYETIVNVLCREYGVFILPPTTSRVVNTFRQELNSFILTASTELVLDTVELTCRVIDRMTRGYNFLHRRDSDKIADASLGEINERFREHGVGYQFVADEIIRVDSELLHAEAVKPALRLLRDTRFQGAQEEFLGAYDHYRHGKNKEALNECLKAFESTMKAICDKRGWPYDPKDSAKKLIDILFANNLIPAFWQTQMGSLRTLLESSVPTGRNKLSGHGQGSTPQPVPDHIAAYMLHMTASTLVFLTTAEEAMP